MSAKLTVTERRLNACIAIKCHLLDWLGTIEDDYSLTSELNSRIMQDMERIRRLQSKVAKEKFAAQLNAEFRAAKLAEGSAVK